jgi:hypothetical protein
MSQAEIFFVLDLLREKYGPGYSDAVVLLYDGGKVEVGSLQAKLSIMLQAAAQRESAR